MFKEIYKNKKVFVTGYTGFKGSWLCAWLKLLGAEVSGYALSPNTNPNHHDLLDTFFEAPIGDIADLDRLRKLVKAFDPDIIFHLAAQPLVRHSYSDPVSTYATNIMGSVNILEAARYAPNLRAFINVTSDKCYRNIGKRQGYIEEDELGGFDPYSNSKACAELVTQSYRDSYFNLDQYQKSHQVLVSSCRAGNVMGGGDWAEDRLIPDLIRAYNTDSNLLIRNPNAVRPWQHVLEPLSGYLLLGSHLLSGRSEFAKAWNFGPALSQAVSVKNIIDYLSDRWPAFVDKVICENSTGVDLHEAELLTLDSQQANDELQWQPVWGLEKTLDATLEWYQAFDVHHQVLTESQLKEYIALVNY